ncbi:MAG TPA: heavy metal-associated domain-containing protein [Cytophagaceae bacterium]|jgi:copper chaperone CopZ|nr:heavy metal-associated domain-containing protein [Cytophagaceae bacterium]
MAKTNKKITTKQFKIENRFISSFFLCIFFIFLLSVSNAQFISAEVGVDGFTCSQCALSVDNSIRQLPFVQDVKMDLNNGVALISFRKNKEISIDKIAKKIYDAGFSVRYIHADYNFNNLSVDDYSIYKEEKDEFHFVGVGKNSFNGPVSIIFLNKRLISKKDYTHWERWIKEDSKRNGKKDNVYYVTLLRG